MQYHVWSRWATVLPALCLCLFATNPAAAQPQTSDQCHFATTCTLVPAKTISCPRDPSDPRPKPCHRIIPAHNVCVTKKVCDGL